MILACFFGVPIALTFRLHAETPGGLSFAGAFGYLYAVWMIVNLWDLLLIDWLYAYLMDPNRPPIEGTAGARGYKDYRFHWKGFQKASLMSLFVHVPTALLISATESSTP